MTKAEKAEAVASLKEALTDCGPKGASTLEIRWVGGGATSTGRSDYFELYVWSMTSGRPEPGYSVTLNAAKAMGYRVNKAREAILMTGCGYSKPLDLAMGLARLVGHDLHVVSSGQFAGPRGLIAA